MGVNMKTIKLFLLAFFVVYLISGCDDNSVNPSEDDIIVSQIIGKWVSKNYETLVLRSDGTFVDTSLAIFSDNPGVYVPHYVVKGKYYVNSEILYFYNVSLLYAKAVEMTPNNIRFGVQLDPRKIKVNTSGLNLQIIKILNPLENNFPNLSGKWEAKSWAGVYDKDIQPYFKGGETKETFQFFNDSSKVNYKNEYLFNTTLYGSNYLGDYTFDGLNFHFQNTTYQIEFKDNKMYWFWYSINYTK